MVPPLPAASRPSKTMMTRRPLCLTQAWRSHNRAWSLRSSFSYFLRPSLVPVSGDWSCFMEYSFCESL